ncbi:MAG: nucleotide exchange factor GrpE [Oscillospiraceae bacterium]|nr:nucleotide exchange factor GrpE [Oscillospiraceae bacterium]
METPATESVPETEPEEEVPAEETGETAGAAEEPEEPEEPEELKKLREQLSQEHDSYLRMAAEYDNYRKRSMKERDELYTMIRAETVGKFLPVYDNLERALEAETTDQVYKKGVEMTMIGLQQVLDNLGVSIFGEKGEPFDPQRHNAVMHEENEELGENVIAEVFQKGAAVGDKVVRFAMVKVAN